MPVTHSPDRASPGIDVENINTSICVICSEALQANRENVETPCKHHFHTDCIHTWLQNNTTCPVCRATCELTDMNIGAVAGATAPEANNRATGTVPRDRPNTRLYARSQQRATASSSHAAQASPRDRRTYNADHPPNTNNISENRVQQIISESMNIFRGQIMASVSSEIQNLFQNLNIERNIGRTSSPTNTRRDEPTAWPRDIPFEEPPANRQPNHRRGESLGTSRISLANEKLSNLIRNWQIRFSGSNDALSIDQFIYRINTLTSLHLNGNHELLCQHVHSLFDGKALKWFWRYRQNSDALDWLELCEAMRRQFKDFSTDSEIRDDIRKRKQKPNEVFDDFLDSIMNMCDRLRYPMNDSDLVETLMRNIKPDLRHELLHLDIRDIVTLRREARKHEKFFRDLQSAVPRQTPLRRQIYEVSHNENNRGEVCSDDVDGNVAVIDSSNIKCWNCEEVGHRYHDCLKTRRIFCYGCGAVDTYKPSCLKCTSENPRREVRQTTDGRPTHRPRN